LNGCDKQYRPGFGTAAVSVAPNGRYVLMVDDAYFATRPEPMQKLILIHEAGHLVLRHIERLFRIQCNLANPTLRKAVMVVYNIAADLACNDKIVRNEPEFKQMLDAGEFDGLLPERMKYPCGLSMEGYLTLLVKDLPQALENMKKMLEAAEKGEGKDEGGGTSISVPLDGGGSVGGSMGGQKKDKGKGGSESDDQTTDDPQVPPGLSAAAQNNPGLIDELEKLFDEISNAAHKLWNKKADQMTAEEAGSLADKMKQHAKRLVKSAHEQTLRSRGNIPAGIDQLVQGLLQPEQIPWHWLLDDALQGAINSKILEEMAMPNMSLLPSDSYDPWPGFTLDRKFRIYWFTDTSGSVSNLEYARACACINSLLSVNKSIELIHLQGDAACQSEEITNNLEPPDPSALHRMGYGGTVYTSQFKRILGVDTPEDWQDPSARPSEHPGKPDLVVVFTDGGVVLEKPSYYANEGETTFPTYKPDVPIIWLVAPGCQPAPGMNNLAPDRVIEMFKIRSEFDDKEG